VLQVSLNVECLSLRIEFGFKANRREFLMNSLFEISDLEEIEEGRVAIAPLGMRSDLLKGS
jgi:hypothetical protein